MAEAKTKPTSVSVDAFLATVAEDRRQDCLTVMKIMQRATGEKPVMWGPSIIGFGTCHYKYASGHEGDMPLTGLSPRKPALTLYLMAGLHRQKTRLRNLGKYKAGKGCLYIQRLADVDMEVLTEMIEASLTDLAQTVEDHVNRQRAESARKRSAKQAK